jgi:chromosome segregation ATPase
MMIDKENIEKSIKELDILKSKTLEETFKQVNHNFRNIFSSHG